MDPPKTSSGSSWDHQSSCASRRGADDVGSHLAHLAPPAPQSALPTPNATPSWWMETWQSPLSSHGRNDPLPDHRPATDVTIIGTGLTGITCALKLIEALSAPASRSIIHHHHPFNIVLIEAREFCSGATGRNGGHLVASAILGAKSISERFSASEAVRAVKLEEKSVEDLLQLIEKNHWAQDVDLVRGGNVHVYDTYQEQARQMSQLEYANSLGLDLSGLCWLDRETAIKDYALKHSVIGALKIPGNNLFPSKLVTKMYQLAQSQASSINGLNLKLFTHTPVLKIDRPAQRGTCWSIRTSRGSFESKYIVHATNAYASYLLPQFGSDRQQTIVPTRAQVIAVQPKWRDANKTWTNGFSANNGFDYFFQRPFDQPGQESRAIANPLVILGGGRNHAAPTFEFGIADDSSVNPNIGNYLRGFLPNWFPRYYGDMDDDDVKHEWTGIMGFTKDHDPIVGPLVENAERLQRQYVAAGYSGHGMSRAPGCAEAVASMILADLMNREWVLPDWLPTHYLTRETTCRE